MYTQFLNYSCDIIDFYNKQTLIFKKIKTIETLLKGMENLNF